MELNELTAISPVDGRYRGTTSPLSAYFSEEALMRYRVKVEADYFRALINLPLPQLVCCPSMPVALRGLYLNFSHADALRIKEIELACAHDVKAVEYFVKERVSAISELAPYVEFVHFGLTSQDVNNTAVPLALSDALRRVMLPELEKLARRLFELADLWDDVPMLARTHGQPASPTRLGKEVRVFAYRLRRAMDSLSSCPLCAKFGGATGNFNAHHAAYPDIDWPLFADAFVARLGLEREQCTTQISNYDSLSAVFDALRRICAIVTDLDRDFWQYVSMEYFRQRVTAGEVGSSAMPHKVNPIDFENSEGNLGVAVALLSHLSMKLPVSRLQRDLTDSTVLRNVGTALGHLLIALHGTLKGLDKLTLNREAIDRDLDASWAVCAEGIQTILRREGYPHPYETLKALTRTGAGIDKETICNFIETLDVSESVKQELRSITPRTYTGM